MAFVLVAVFVANRDAKLIVYAPSDDENSSERTAQQDLHFSRNTDTRGSKPCLPYIFYDRPVKTGSTSVRSALQEYILSTGGEIMRCDNRGDCRVAAEQVCAGVRPPAHMTNHLVANTSLVNCLHGMGFYHVTSIREPKARILSVYKYNKVTSGQHNGIHPDAPFEEFLRKFPRCALYRYYDGLSGQCGDDKEAIESRAVNIVNRMDEVIDLTQEPISDVHSRIDKFVKVLNVVAMTTSNASHFEIPDEVAGPEYVLYNKLKEKRKQLARQSRSVLCEFSHENMGY